MSSPIYTYSTTINYTYDILSDYYHLYMEHEIEVWEKMHKVYVKIKKSKRLNAIKRIYKEEI